MALSPRDKQSFYEHLAQFLRAGVPLRTAVDKLAATSSGPVRGALGRLRESLAGGKTAAEAFASLGGMISDTERAAIAALGRTGRMESGLQQLADYFGVLHAARGEIIHQSLYPFISLNLGFLMLNITSLFGDNGTEIYLRRTAFLFFCFYGVLALIAGVFWSFRNYAAANPTVDWIYQMVPFSGKIRRAFSLARFCATYNLQIDAGVNVIDSLAAAGLASQSGRIRAAVDRALPHLRTGAQVGPLLASSRAFPESFTRTFLVAEDTGELDRALSRLTAQYQADGLTRMKRLSYWLPRMISAGVMIYLGWQIVSMYRGYLDTVMRQLDTQ